MKWIAIEWHGCGKRAYLPAVAMLIRRYQFPFTSIVSTHAARQRHSVVHGSNEMPDFPLMAFFCSAISFLFVFPNRLPIINRCIYCVLFEYTTSMLLSIIHMLRTLYRL